VSFKRSHSDKEAQTADGYAAGVDGGGVDQGAYQGAFGNQFMVDMLQQQGDAAEPDALQCEHGHGHDAGEPDAGVGAARAGAPRTKARALRRHETNRSRIDRILRSAMAQQVDPTAGANSRVNLLRNTAEWIDAGEANLYVMTPTHDAHLRANCPADKLAYFDTRKTYDQPGADYDATLDAAGQATNDAGMEFKFSTVAGSMSSDGITMMLIDPVSFSEGKIVQFFIHEVQHDADQHNGGQAWRIDQPAADPAAVTRAPEWSYNNYASEFRAYWMMNPEGSGSDWFSPSSDTAVTDFTINAITGGADTQTGSADDVTTSATTAFTHKRQEDIFNHMFSSRADNIYLQVAADGSNDWTQSYAYLPHYYANDPAFKTFVDGYTQPVSGNLINSPRIQALSEAIEAGRLFPEVSALENLDLAYLQDRAQCQPLWDQAAGKLSWFNLAMLGIIVDAYTIPAGPSADFVTVVAGDSLSAIADRYLDDAGRWREIYRLNRDTVGDDPNSILVDMQLLMPPL